MKTVQKWINRIRTDGKFRQQWLPSLGAMAALIALYLTSLVVPVGWITYLVSLPPALIIIITALARINDIGPELDSKRWHVRRAGLTLSGLGGAAFLFCPFTSPALFPSWKVVALLWGVALTWLTTPNMPPWWKYITGEFKQND